MIIRKSLVAAGVLVAALGMTACGSDDSTDTTASSTTAATTSASSTSAATDTDAAPSKDVLQQQLTVFFDPATTVEQKEAVVERGTDRAALVEQFNGVLAGYPLTATVTEVKTDGGTVTAVTDIAGPHGGAPVPVTFTEVNGTWVISDASTCEIFGMGRVSCA
ncbi:nuclear transport factor 2 family protein [Prescottella sp. R16]|uniref:nuclear transport factor 2 family protein n=1 Tax=Prescottella sp. R16 TaxID=3064529 RepID=UPI00272E720C|nr:nuclear transport factor 2 family protein [Prescottella sp. R16]